MPYELFDHWHRAIRCLMSCLQGARPDHARVNIEIGEMDGLKWTYILQEPLKSWIHTC